MVEPGRCHHSSFCPLPQAGAYYPAQGVQQFPAGVAPAPVLVNQPPQIAPKRERKTVSDSRRSGEGLGNCEWRSGTLGHW